jgi:transcriptional regulator with XRE-family HTH domain
MRVVQPGRKPQDRHANQGIYNPVDIAIGMKVRERRTMLGMSQETLGAAIGLTFQQVQKYERGANRIGASRLYDIAQALDVAPGYFFDGLSAEATSQSPAKLNGAKPQPIDTSDALTRKDLEIGKKYRLLGQPARQAVLNLINVLLHDDGQETKRAA